MVKVGLRLPGWQFGKCEWKNRRKMMRTRLVWFGIGFSLSSAAISHFVWKDLMLHRYALSSDMKRKFDALEDRILNLESVPYHDSNPTPQIEG